MVGVAGGPGEGRRWGGAACWGKMGETDATERGGGKDMGAGGRGGEEGGGEEGDRLGW